MNLTVAKNLVDDTPNIETWRRLGCHQGNVNFYQIDLVVNLQSK